MFICYLVVVKPKKSDVLGIVKHQTFATRNKNIEVVSDLDMIFYISDEQNLLFSKQSLLRI